MKKFVLFVLVSAFTTTGFAEQNYLCVGKEGNTVMLMEFIKQFPDAQNRDGIDYTREYKVQVFESSSTTYTINTTAKVEIGDVNFMLDSYDGRIQHHMLLDDAESSATINGKRVDFANCWITNLQSK